MRRDIHERQIELKMKVTERDRLKRRFEAKETERREAEVLRDRLAQHLTKEQQDVVKFGKFSFANKFRELTGKWDTLMEKEIAEAAEAELKWNEAEKTLGDITREAEDLRRQLANPDFIGLGEEWQAFLKEKEIWVRNNDPIASAKLNAVADESAALQSLLREIAEAIDAGQDAKRTLNAAMDELRSAQGMSMWDTFLGGGLIVTALKYSHINSSDDKIHRAQSALRRFQTELADVQNMSATDLTINKRDFLTFTDFFFDNIFTDWMVHSKINNTKSQVDSILADVERTIRELRARRERTITELEQLAAREKEIIVS